MRLGLKKDLIYKELDARINNFMCKYICPQLKVDKAQDYRWKRYWNEPVDNLYKFHMKLFQEVYKNYSGTLKLPGEENYMGASEFEKIWTDSKLQNDRFANRDMNVCFNLAMQTRVDEYNAYRHIKMTFIEFLEAFARAADYLSYPPASVSIHEEYLRTNTNELEKPEENNYEDDEEDVTLEEMISQPLSKKIENILPYVLNNWTSRTFKKKWTWPVKNPKYGLYEEAKKEDGTAEVKSIISKGISKMVISKIGSKFLLKTRKNV